MAKNHKKWHLKNELKELMRLRRAGRIRLFIGLIGIILVVGFQLISATQGLSWANAPAVIVVIFVVASIFAWVGGGGLRDISKANTRIREINRELG